jgi:hypothetical protein
MIVGIFLIATALGCLSRKSCQEKKRSPASPSRTRIHPPQQPQCRKTFPVMALMIGYSLVLKTLGFLISICVFLVVAIRIFGYRRWVPALAIATVTAGISTFVRALA